MSEENFQLILSPTFLLSHSIGHYIVVIHSNKTFSEIMGKFDPSDTQLWNKFMTLQAKTMCGWLISLNSSFMGIIETKIITNWSLEIHEKGIFRTYLSSFTFSKQIEIIRLFNDYQSIDAWQHPFSCFEKKQKSNHFKDKVLEID